ERSDRYRSLVADRRFLVLLDDAVDETQVRPLLPGGGAVLVTTRRRLPGIEGATGIDLPLLPSAEAMALLTSLVGAGRIAADRESAERIVERCGLLPLAVRAAGAKLAARPHWKLADLAGRLADERRRLTMLKVGDLDVRASVELSYRSCSKLERRAFRLLADVPAREFSAWVLAAACDTDLATAEAVAEGLLDAQLLQASGRDGLGHPRYRLHDLFHAVALERLLDEDSEAARQRAVTRVLAAYCELVSCADAMLRPGQGVLQPAVPDSGRWLVDTALLASVVAAPAGWFAAERASLVAVVAKAHATARWPLTWATAEAVIGFLDPRSEGAAWRVVGELALEAAQQAGDEPAAMTAKQNLGLLQDGAAARPPRPQGRSTARAAGPHRANHTAVAAGSTVPPSRQTGPLAHSVAP
ncbi:MAG: NB-ARC domain-containing protein, partial [Micromonosporaceae bacterium]